MFREGHSPSHGEFSRPSQMTSKYSLFEGSIYIITKDQRAFVIQGGFSVVIRDEQA